MNELKQILVTYFVADMAKDFGIYEKVDIEYKWDFNKQAVLITIEHKQNAEKVLRFNLEMAEEESFDKLDFLCQRFALEILKENV